MMRRFGRVRVRTGTPFESDHDWTSFGGYKWLCKAKRWCDLRIEMLSIPPGAVKAEVLVAELHAAQDDNKVEHDPFFKLPDGPLTWPTR